MPIRKEEGGGRGGTEPHTRHLISALVLCTPWDEFPVGFCLVNYRDLQGVYTSDSYLNSMPTASLAVSTPDSLGTDLSEPSP